MFGLCRLREQRMALRKEENRVTISAGMSHSLGSQSDGYCIYEMNSSSFSRGRPEK